jgi:hypothetical protein
MFHNKFSLVIHFSIDPTNSQTFGMSHNIASKEGCETQTHQKLDQLGTGQNLTAQQDLKKL